MLGVVAAQMLLQNGISPRYMEFGGSRSIESLYGRKRRVSQRCVNPGFFKGGFLMIFLCSKRVGLHSLLHFFPICRFWWFGAAYAVIFAWHDLGKLHSVESVRRSALAIQSAK